MASSTIFSVCMVRLFLGKAVHDTGFFRMRPLFYQKNVQPILDKGILEPVLETGTHIATGSAGAIILFCK